MTAKVNIYFLFRYSAEDSRARSTATNNLYNAPSKITKPIALIALSEHSTQATNSKQNKVLIKTFSVQIALYFDRREKTVKLFTRSLQI